MKRRLFVIVSVLAIAALALSLSALYPAMSESQRRYPKKPVPGRGLIKSTDFGIYADQACTTPISSINWGILDPSSTVNRTVYIRNEGNAVAGLGMTLSNWNPVNAADYITFTWDYAGQTLDVGRVTQITLTLYIRENIQGITNFTFDMTITAN